MRWRCPQGTSVFAYKDVDSDDPAARVAGYLSYSGPNMLFYSVLRAAGRGTGSRLHEGDAGLSVVSRSDPVPAFSAERKIYQAPAPLLCLRYRRVGHAETAQKRDIDFYQAAGLDPAANKLHWLLCGFEGAAMIMNADGISRLSGAAAPGDRRSLVYGHVRPLQARCADDIDSPYTDEADKLCAKIAGSTGQLSFERILADISGFFALFSKQRAQAYFDFWDSVLSRRRPSRPEGRGGETLGGMAYPGGPRYYFTSANQLIVRLKAWRRREVRRRLSIPKPAHQGP